MNLLRRPTGGRGRVHHITPEDAGWGHVAFDLWRLQPGDAAAGATGAREVILVLVEGRARISGAAPGNSGPSNSGRGNAGQGGALHDWGEMGGRLDVFEKTPPHCLYLPPGSDWRAEATTGCTLAVCSAPGRDAGRGAHPARRIGPDGIALTPRGRGANTRHIHNIAMEAEDYCDSLLVTEVFTPEGNWSSYPPHRHDEDDFPNITRLEETYYHRLNPPQGFGIQRVFTEDGTLDQTMAVSDHDVVLVPRGHHPCGVPHGYEMYYLNVMAGPLRKWRFRTHPDHDWIARRDNPPG